MTWLRPRLRRWNGRALAEYIPNSLQARGARRLQQDHVVRAEETTQSQGGAIRDGVIAYATLVTPDGRTRSGARVGMSETALRRLYGSRLEVSPSPRGHPGEQWLVYAPRFAADSAYRMVFETDGVNVGAIIAGRWPFDRAVEGCAP